MSLLKDLKEPLSSEIKDFQKVFKKSVKSSVPLLDVVMQYILRSKGKQIRPLIVLYSAKLFDGINDSTYRAATLVELLHTATLVHDDVVDESDRRRGRFSINALWNNKLAVLVGDYLLSRGMLASLKAKDYHLLEIVSEAVKEMSEGELLQIEKARKLDINESVYYDIIRKKTASLMASCFAVGAASALQNEEVVKKMWKIGEYTGIAFQIKDDIFDFQKSSKIGKPTGIDIKEKKMTLPLIYLLNNSSYTEKRKTINIVKRHNTNREKVNWLLQKVVASGGIDYAEQKMTEYSNKALELLKEFPENQARLALEQIITFTTERKK
jgi:octaprenyl-diphosphate synthase